MKLIQFNLFLFSIVLLTFSSCNWLQTEEVTVSSNPHFVSLTFAVDDSIPALSSAVFTLEWDDDLNDSVIVNLDSLPYNTSIDTVIPTFTFQSSSVAYVYLKDSLGTGIDTLTITGKDTINFNKIISVENFAADGITTSKPYLVKVNVHKVIPDLYVWKKISDGISTSPFSNQKAILFNDSLMLYYMANSVKNYLYTSIDGISWNKQNLNNLPLDCNLKNMTYYNGKLYIINKEADINTVSGEIYSSYDGINWTKEDYNSKDFAFVSFLFDFKGKLWAVTKSKDNSLYYLRTFDGQNWTDDSVAQVGTNFPIDGFAALSFASATNKPKAIIAGGYNASGELLNSIWSTENGTYWIDFSTENTSLGSLAGSTIISYDKKLLLFGGMNITGKIVEKNYMESLDDGLSWSEPDTTYNQLIDLNTEMVYSKRSYQSAFVKDKRIYLIGGSDNSAAYNDVWTGKLNKLSFLIQ